MPFEGALLAAGVARALFAIPGAIKDTQSLLSKSEPAQEKLNGLSDLISQFCQVGDSLTETKEIHDLLHAMDVELEEVGTLFSKAVAHGGFSRDAYNVPLVRRVWQNTKSRPLVSLLAKAEVLRYIEPEPLIVDSHNNVVSGPDWATRLIELRNNIDDMFDQYDKHQLDNVLPLANEMNALLEHVKRTYATRKLTYPR